MSTIKEPLIYEQRVKKRMKAVIKARRISYEVAANQLKMSKASFSRHLNPDETTRLTLVFCKEFARAFCNNDISLLLSDKQENDDVLAYVYDMERVFYGLSPEIQQGIYDRAVSEADAFREALRKK